jgi:hypothetical protein
LAAHCPTRRSSSQSVASQNRNRKRIACGNVLHTIRCALSASLPW